MLTMKSFVSQRLFYVARVLIFIFPCFIALQGCREPESSVDNVSANLSHTDKANTDTPKQNTLDQTALKKTTLNDDKLINKSLQVELFSGPMTSIPRATSVGIWLQATPLTRVAIQYWPLTKPKTWLVWEGKTDEDGLLKADIDALFPLTDYAYNLTLAEQKQEGIYNFKTLVDDYFPQVHDVRFLFGSCSWWKDSDYPIMQTMAKHPADFMLWLGDNLYLEPSDYDRAEGMSKKYARVRQHNSLNTLLTSKPQIATWDDHDYGRNDATRDWIFKEEARNIFSKYWINPSYGTPDVPGIQTQFRLSDIDFFLLDGRTFRDSPNMLEPKQMFGSDQLRWLKNNVLNSRARLKVLISGSQWLNPMNTFEGWNLYSKEQSEFLSWLNEKNIPGVIFLSGDRHFTEVLQQKREGTYPLYDITCSPLTSILVKELKDIEKNNPFRLDGTLVMQHNYCEMNVTGDKDNRIISISSYSAAGDILWNKKIPYSELGL